MYDPPHFTETGAATIRSLIKTNGFATVVPTSRGRPIASHLPAGVRNAGPSDQLVLEGHVERGNPLGETFLPDAEATVLTHPFCRHTM